MRLLSLGVGPWALEISLSRPGADVNAGEEPEEFEEGALRLADTAFGFSPDPAFRDPYPYEDEDRKRLR